MNPYLKISRPAGWKSYFYSRQIIEGAWPELSPASDTSPTVEFKLLSEQPVPLSSRQLKAGRATYEIYLDGVKFGTFYLQTNLNLDFRTGEISYDIHYHRQPDIGYGYSSKSIYEADDWLEENIGSKINEVAKEWKGPPPQPDWEKLEPVLQNIFQHQHPSATFKLEHPSGMRFGIVVANLDSRVMTDKTTQFNIPLFEIADHPEIRYYPYPRKGDYDKPVLGELLRKIDKLSYPIYRSAYEAVQAVYALADWYLELQFLQEEKQMESEGRPQAPKPQYQTYEEEKYAMYEASEEYGEEEYEYAERHPVRFRDVELPEQEWNYLIQDDTSRLDQFAYELPRMIELHNKEEKGLK